MNGPPLPFAPSTAYSLPYEFDSPYSIAVDGRGNLYVGSGGEKTVKKVSPAGEISILWEDQNSIPEDLAVDDSGNVYVSLVELEDRRHRIIRLGPDGRQTTLANTGQFGGTRHLVVARQGMIYFSNPSEHVIKRLTPDGTVTTVAGSGVAGDRDGPGPDAQFKDPAGLAIDESGNLYVADKFNSKIRKVTPDGRVVTLTANVPNPDSLALDHEGNLLVPYHNGNAILRVTPQGQVSWWAGDGVRCYSGPISLAEPGPIDKPEYSGPGYPDPCETLINGPRLNARFLLPGDIAINAAGSVFLLEGLRKRIRRIEPGPGPEPRFTPEAPSPAPSPVVEEMVLAAVTAPTSGLVNEPVPIEVTGILPDASWITYRAKAVLDPASRVVTIEASRLRLEAPRPTEALRPAIMVPFFAPENGTYIVNIRILRDGASSEEEVSLPIRISGGSPPWPEPRPAVPDPHSPPPSPPPTK